MIWKNFVRDLRRTASRLISVSIITMIAVMVYTALSGILTNIERISASYLDGQNVADYWLTGVNLDQGDCRTLEGIAGVTGVQPRVVLDAEERHDSSVTLQLYAVPGDYAINTPYVVEGPPAGEQPGDCAQRYAGKGPGAPSRGLVRADTDGNRPVPAGTDQRTGQRPGVPLLCEYHNAGPGFDPLCLCLWK